VIAGLVDAFRDLGCLEADSILVVRVSTLFCQPGFEVTLYGIGLYTFVAIRGLSIKVRLNVYYQAQARSIQSSRKFMEPCFTESRLRVQTRYTIP
jgi:hypothetical protein